MMLANWVSFTSASTISSGRPSIAGDKRVFFISSGAYCVPTFCCAIAAGTSYEYYNIASRIQFANYTLVLFGVTVLTCVSGWANYQRLRNLDDQFHKTQLVRMTLVLAVVVGNATVFTALNAILLPQIDGHTGWILFFQACYRVSVWIILIGSAIYAWAVTTWKSDSDKSSGRTRHTASGSKGVSEHGMYSQSFTLQTGKSSAKTASGKTAAHSREDDSRAASSNKI